MVPGDDPYLRPVAATPTCNLGKPLGGSVVLVGRSLKCDIPAHKDTIHRVGCRNQSIDVEQELIPLVVVGIPPGAVPTKVNV